jgi:hypothetical protein
MQILVVHVDDMLTPRHECALDAAMADLDAFCIIRHVDDAALALVRNLCFPGKRETQLFMTSPRDVPVVMAKLAAWTCE